MDIRVIVAYKKFHRFHPSRVKIRETDRRKVKGFIHKDKIQSVLCYERLYLNILQPSRNRSTNRDEYVTFFEIRNNSLEDYSLKNRFDWQLEISGRLKDDGIHHHTNGNANLDLLMDVSLQANNRLEPSGVIKIEQNGIPFSEVSPSIRALAEGRWKTKDISEPIKWMKWGCNAAGQTIELDTADEDITKCDSRTIQEFLGHRGQEMDSVQEGDADELESTSKRLSSDSTLIDLEGYLELDLEWMKFECLRAKNFSQESKQEVVQSKILPVLKSSHLKSLRPFVECIIRPALNQPDLKHKNLAQLFLDHYNMIDELLTATPDEVIAGVLAAKNIGWTKCFYWLILSNHEYFQQLFTDLLTGGHPDLETELKAVWYRDEEVPQCVQDLTEGLTTRWTQQLVEANDNILASVGPVNMWAGRRILINDTISAWEMTGNYGAGIQQGRLCIVNLCDPDPVSGKLTPLPIRWFKNKDNLQEDCIVM